jgi:putative ABC transport system ATP-binding protein
MEERTHMRLSELGYVFQDYALIPELTATENVMTPLLMQGKTFDDAKNISLGMLEKASNNFYIHLEWLRIKVQIKV